MMKTKMTEVKLKIFEHDPFLLYILNAIPFSFNKEIKTAATNGYEIFINKEFYEKLSVEDLTFVIIHELMHILYEHPKRAIGKDAIYYNVASDIVINDSLINGRRYQLKFKISEDLKPVLGEQFDIDGFRYSSEQIYDYLVKKAPKSELIKLFGFSDNHTLWKDFKGLSPELYKRIIDYSKDYNNNSSLYKEVMSRADVKNFKNKYMNRYDWKNELSKYLSQMMIHDYGYTYNRIKDTSSDLIIPNYHLSDVSDYSMNDIWFFIDVSGSVSNEDLVNYFGTILDMLAQFNQYKIIVSFFSTIVTKPKYVTSEKELIKLKDDIKSTGGTDIPVIFEYIKESKYKPKTIIIFTDGYSRYPNTNPLKNTNVLWLLNSDYKNIPFGKKIYL